MERSLKQNSLKLSTIVFMLYIFIASGAYGIESMIGEAGPGMTIILLLVLPIVWGLPFGLISAELASGYPNSGGLYYWIKKALGEFWGFQAGWSYTLCSFVDTAVYLVLSVGYVEWIFSFEFTSIQRWLICVVITIIFTLLNIKGIDLLGFSSTISTIVLLAPFVVVTVLGIINWKYNPMQPIVPQGDTVFGSASNALLIGMWMYAGYEAIGSFGDEIEDSKKLIPKALIWVMPIVAISYILPTVAGIAAVGNWADWSTEGPISFVEMGAMMGGPLLGLAFMISALISNLSLYNSYLASSSRIPFAMAEDGLYFKSFDKIHPKYGTPYVSIIISAVIMALLSFGSFEALIVIDMFLYLIPIGLMFLSAIILRYKNPNNEGSYKIPVSNKTFVAITIIPIILCLYALFADDPEYWIMGGIASLTGLPAYYLFKWYYKKGRMDHKKEEDKILADSQK